MSNQNSSNRSNRLETIEAARGFAASAVVLFHANASAAQFHGVRFTWISLFEHGVDFFFVLSGFIIFSAHYKDIGHPEKIRSYLLKRGIRLFPLLWLVVLVWSAVRGLSGAGPNILQVVNSMFLWPSTNETIPAVVWTLRHEVLFYIAFCVLMISPAKGKTLLSVWAVAVVGQAIAVLLGHPASGGAALILSTYTLDFLIGCILAEGYRRDLLPKGWSVLFLSLIFLIAVLFVEIFCGLHRAAVTDYTSLSATFWTPVLGIAFAGVIAGLLAVENRIRVPRWLILLGAASYAIYLVHLPVNTFSQRIASHLPHFLTNIGGGHMFVLICGIAAGIVMHLAFEVPVSRWLRRRLLPGSAPGVAEQATR